MKAIRKDGWDGEQPWLHKGSALYRKCWHEFNPKFICVRRDRDAIFQSVKKSRMLSTRGDEKLKEVIDLHEKEMDASGGINIDTQAVVDGDYSSLEAALAHCGLTMDESKVREFVEPRHWNHRAA